MKIALFVHCFFPTHFYGTETYTLQVATQLRSMGHDPVVVSAAFPGEPRRERAVTTYRYDGLRVYCIDKNYILQHRVKGGRGLPLVAQADGERFNELGLVHVLSSDTQWLDSREFSFAQRMALVSRIQT